MVYYIFLPKIGISGIKKPPGGGVSAYLFLRVKSPPFFAGDDDQLMN